MTRDWNTVLTTEGLILKLSCKRSARQFVTVATLPWKGSDRLMPARTESPWEVCMCSSRRPFCQIWSSSPPTQTPRTGWSAPPPPPPVAALLLQTSSHLCPSARSTTSLSVCTTWVTDARLILCIAVFILDLLGPSGLTGADWDHLCAGVRSDSWSLSYSSLGHSPLSQSGCDDALVWRLKRGGGWHTRVTLVLSSLTADLIQTACQTATRFCLGPVQIPSLSFSS